MSPDGLEYRFFLAPNAVWEDGTPVTAADAVFTIRKAADPKVPSPVFKPLFSDLESVEAIDAKSFRARFRRRDALRAHAFTLPLLPEKRFAGKSFLKARENRAPLSNGPYRARVVEVPAIDRAREQSALAGHSRELRPDRVSGRAGERGGLPLPRRGRARRDVDRSVPEGPRRHRRALRVVLPHRRVLQPRLQLRGAQQPLAAVLRRPRAARDDDAPRPARDRARPLPRLREDHLGAVGARLAGLRRLADRAAIRSSRGRPAARAGGLAGHRRRPHAGPRRTGARVRPPGLGRFDCRPPDQRDLRGGARPRRRQGERPHPRVGHVRRARRLR